jgi:hypothetical protein
MYKLDSSTNLSPLIGKELIQVCIGLYQVILRFTGELSITIQCLYFFSKEGDTFEGSGEDPSTSKNLVCLLGHSIESAEIQGDNKLIINFSNSCCLALVNDSEVYESFIVTDGIFEIIA